MVESHAEAGTYVPLRDAYGVVDPGLPSNGFTLVCAALVFLMIPGLGLFYSGLSNSKNALSMVLVCFLSTAVATVQWFLFGFSLTFADGGNSFIGDARHFALTSIGAEPLPFLSPFVSGVTVVLYQLQFSAIACSLVFGSVMGRFRIAPALLFAFLWTTFVYCITARWSFSPRGWCKNMLSLEHVFSDRTGGDGPKQIGDLDFAGGGPIHVASGFSGLAFCIYIGKRNQLERIRPHNMSFVALGTGLLWFGWFGFNGGAKNLSSARSSMAALVSMISAGSGGLAWMVVDWLHSKKWSGLGFCSGAVAGLVGITPGAGFVAPWAALIIGAISGAVVSKTVMIKEYLHFDDTLDVFGFHGMGGIVGCVLTGVFAQKWLGEVGDEEVFNGGWVDGHWIQVPVQLAAACTIAAWSFVVTYIILVIINLIPGMRLRASHSVENIGIDHAEIGEAIIGGDETNAHKSKSVQLAKANSKMGSKEATPFF